MTEINRSERKKTGAMNLRSTVKVGKWLTKKKKKKSGRKVLGHEQTVGKQRGEQEDFGRVFRIQF